MSETSRAVIPYKSLETGRSVLVVVFLAVAAWYLAWRLETFNPNALLFSWILYAAEVYGMVTVLLHLFMTWRLTERNAPPPPAGYRVDVFIPTINESAAIVRPTVLAAMNMEYPHHTWLLDDGNRPEMRALSKELGCRYVVRTQNTHAKAGNLNNALQQSQADFVVVFDADHAPHRKFLMRTLGYFLDAQVAFVQTPQDFYNLDSYQHRATGTDGVVWTEQSLFFRVIQRGKDYWNAAFFCGSCAVIRRTALDAIGGFATGTVTEDLHTSLKIHKRGYRSVYHAEPLAFGLAPSSIVPFMKQRIRWGQGAMQVWRQEGIFLFARGLTVPQRLNYLASAMTYFDGWQKGLLYIAPVVVLVTGVTPMRVLGPEFWFHFIPYYALVFWVFEEVGRGYGRTVFIEQYNMGRFAGFAWATLGIFTTRLKFAVTPKAVTPKKETYRFITPQILVLFLNGMAIPVSMALYYRYGHLSADVLAANIVWASVNLALALAIILYSLRMSGFKRKEYRFPIPLPARIQLGDRPEQLCTIDNISSSGCRIYGYFPGTLQRNTQVDGVMFFPKASLPFVGKVTSIITGVESSRSFVKAVGCLFDWPDSTQRDSLDVFLYGSDLQWRINQFNDAVVTPLDRWCGYTRNPQWSIPIGHWSVMFFKRRGESHKKSHFGLISSSGQLREIITFEPLSGRSNLIVAVLSPKGKTLFEGKLISGETQLESPISPMYAYKIEKSEDGKRLPA